MQHGRMKMQNPENSNKSAENKRSMMDHENEWSGSSSVASKPMALLGFQD